MNMTLIMLLMGFFTMESQAKQIDQRRSSLELRLANLKGEKIYLVAFVGKKTEIVDSAVVKSERDTLFLQGLAHEEEQWYQLRISKRYSLNPVLSKDSITILDFDINMVRKGFSEADHYVNSNSSKDFNQMTADIGPLLHKKYLLKQSAKLETDPNAKILLSSKVDSVGKLISGYYLNVFSESSSVATIERALQWLQMENTGDTYEDMLGQLAKRFPDSKTVLNGIEWFKKYNGQSSELQTTVLVNGIVAPDFSFKTSDGLVKKLADYRGSYVLLDFWASWCVPCRKESPFLKLANTRFKNNKFLIIQVSIDKPEDEAKWRKAIQEDGVEDFVHTNLYPNHTVYKDYNINSLPTNYLISPAGKILESNFRGEDLSQRIANLMSLTNRQ